MVEKKKVAKRSSKKVAKKPSKAAASSAAEVNQKAKSKPATQTKSSAAPAKTPAKKSTPKKAASSSSKNTSSKPSTVKQTEKVMTTKAAEKAPSTTIDPAVAAPQAVVVKSGGGIGWLALLTSLGALGLSGYMYFQGMQKGAVENTATAVGISEVKKDVERLDGSISDIKTNLTTLSSDVAGVKELGFDDSKYVTLAAMEKTVSDKIQPVIADQATIQNSVEQISNTVSGVDNSYELNRARQLLESAQYQLDHQGDVDGGIKLLSLAGETIKGIDLKALNSARSKVLSYVETLQSIETPDLVAVSNKLGSLSKDVANWPLQNEPKAEVIQKAEVETAVSEAEGFWNEMKGVAKEAFNESFKVQKVGAKPKALLAPQERYFLDQNLKLKLQSAQTAMLQGQQTIYTDIVGDSKDWIVEYFDTNDARVSDAVEDLSALSSIELSPELPDISDALSAFDRVAQTESAPTKELSSPVYF